MNNFKLKMKTINIIIVSMIVLLTTIVFFNVIYNDFVNYDDPQFIIKNLKIRDLSFDGIKKIFGSYDVYYQALTIFSHTIEYHFFGLDPKFYHLNNLILHLLNTFLVFWLFNKVTKKIIVAGVVALLFGIHPMHVESVAWVTERKDVLYGFFYLFSLIAYVYYLHNNKKLKFLIISLLLFILSLMAKPAAVTLPLLLFLLDYYKSRKIDKWLFLDKIPFLIFALIAGLITMSQAKAVEGIYDYTSVYTSLQHLLLVSYSIGFYFLELILPLNLCIIHHLPRLNNDYLPLIYYISPLFIFAWIALIIAARRFRKNLIFGTLFFLFAISVMLQIVPVSQGIVTERYTYISYIGLFYIVGQLIHSLVNSEYWNISIIKNISLAFFFFMIFLYSILTINRTRVWEDTYTLMSDLVEKYPDRHFGYIGLGNSYLIEHDYENAFVYFDKAVQLEPRSYLPFYSRGGTRLKLNDYEGALYDFNISRELKPNYTHTYNNLGVVKSYLGDLEGSLSDLNKAIELDPENYEAYNNLGNFYAKKNNFAEAIKYFDKTIKINPYLFDAYLNRGNAKIELKQFAASIPDFDAAIKLEPQKAGVIYNRGSAKLFLEDIPGACTDWLIASKMGYQNADIMLKKYCGDHSDELSAAIENKNFINDQYPNGQQKYWIIVNIENKDTIKKFRHYNEQGIVIEEGIIVNGLYNGKVNWFYDNGIIKTSGFMKDTIPYGIWKEYYIKGILKAQYKLLNGIKHGSYQYFHSNGNLWTERIYNMGRLWEVVSNFDLYGNSKDPGTLKNGNGVLFIYDENGNLIAKKSYKSGQALN